MTDQEDAIQAKINSLPDDSFYNYILYILKNDPPSDAAVKRSHQQIYVQDVSELPDPLPDWLVGVPTLFDKSMNRVRQGQECLDYLSAQ